MILQANIFIPVTGATRVDMQARCRLAHRANIKKAPDLQVPYPLRAKNGTRTRDPNLGKVMLYQLSYFRIAVANIRVIRESAKFSAIFFAGNFYFLSRRRRKSLSRRRIAEKVVPSAARKPESLAVRPRRTSASTCLGVRILPRTSMETRKSQPLP